MKKIYQYVWVSLAVLLLGSCAKDALWNGGNDIPDSGKGTIVGQLINDDDNTPLKAVKILFERQTGKDGTNSFVDTVSTNSEGKFSYSVPFPNKVRLVVRDTGRYAADSALVEVLEHKDYSVALNSHPRFGTAEINVSLGDELGAAEPNLHVALLVRESSTESYSPVDTLVTDANGKVSFASVAFPVQYMVKLTEPGYTADEITGVLISKAPVNLAMPVKAVVVKLVAKYFFTMNLASNITVSMSVKKEGESEFSAPKLVTFNADGALNLKGFVYPAEIKFETAQETTYPFLTTSVQVNFDNADKPININLFDSTPRFNQLTPSPDASENTLVTFYDGLDIRSIEVDDKGNIFGITRSNTLVRIPFDGSQHKVLATGFEAVWGLALEDSHTLYAMENTNAESGKTQNNVKKIVIDPVTDEATVTVLVGNNTKGGTDGSFDEATFSRPGDAVYDSKRKALWLVEWEGRRIRKIDLVNKTVSTVASGIGRFYSVTLSADKNFLYIASFNVNPGVHKFDIENGTDTRIVSGGDVRHVVVTPDDKVFYEQNKEANSNIYHVSNTGGTISTAAGNGTRGLPAANYVGPANVALASEGSKDFVLEGMAYDPYSGRLYFSAPLDKRLYYIKLSSAF